MFVILVLALQLTEVTGQFSPRFVVRDGDDITLPCNNSIDDRDTCGKTQWLFSNSQDASVLVSSGKQVLKKPERLKVATNCSLVLSKVSDEDVGFYTCRTSHSRHDHDSHVFLFLITMTEKEEGEQVKVSCFVSAGENCKHTVEWLHEGKPVEDARTVRTSRCFVTLVFPAGSLQNNSKYRKLSSCKVKDELTEREQLFRLSLQSADNEANTTTVPPGTVPAVRDTSTTPLNLWLYIVVTIGLVALITTVVMLMVWIKREDEKSKMLEDVELNLNSTAVLSDPETNPDMADPEDDVSYATICHAKNSKSKTRVSFLQPSSVLKSGAEKAEPLQRWTHSMSCFMFGKCLCYSASCVVLEHVEIPSQKTKQKKRRIFRGEG
ncbi:uncharacterized protein V3H82_027016 isoform 2-T2 [Fundulus diaphanus]